jgi:L-idonate 5-dehydrogenase
METQVVRLHKVHDLRIETEEYSAPGEGEVLIRAASGGICGSDLHYFHHGGIGDVRVLDPIILGHEASGTVVQVGAGVEHLKAGDGVAINPSTPCDRCKYCVAGLQQHCMEMLFMGSAMYRPHRQGAFREHLVVRARNCIPVSTNTPLQQAALAEPLAVCLHAANRVAGKDGDALKGKNVIVTGAGPIGGLCAAVAKYLGAANVVITDIETFTLSVASQMGATTTIDVSSGTDELEQYERDKGYFDFGFECSGAAAALSHAVRVLKPQGTLVQVGNAAVMPVPFSRVVPREITITGSFRFHEEFNTAVNLINDGLVNVEPLISQQLPMSQAVEAFQLASDRSQAVKVLLTF